MSKGTKSAGNGKSSVAGWKNVVKSPDELVCNLSFGKS